MTTKMTNKLVDYFSADGMHMFKDINIKTNKMSNLITVTELVFNQDGKYYPGTQIQINKDNIIETKQVNGMTQLICKNGLTLFVKD